MIWHVNGLLDIVVPIPIVASSGSEKLSLNAQVMGGRGGSGQKHTELAEAAVTSGESQGE